MPGAAARNPSLEAGSRLGRYELLLPVARGGMATVWAARLRGSHGFEKLVAVKTMLPGMSSDPEFERMFLAEADLASRIRHPNVVEVLDLGEEDGVLYLVMEWIDGEPLNRLMRAAPRGGLPLGIAVEIVTQACSGLHAAHELTGEDGAPLGLVHRDVSPQNLLVTFGGVTKIADFGIAKAMALGQSATQLGEVKGKVAYMSPEQISRLPVDRRTDLFALGILLYELATGRHPFRGASDGETLANILMAEPPPGCPPQLESVLQCVLAKNPEERPETASALRRALQAALPPSERSTGYEELAEYVESLFDESRGERRARLTAALNAASQEPTGSATVTRDSGAARARTRWKVTVLGAGAAALGAGALWLGSVSGDHGTARSERAASTATAATAPAAGGSAVAAPEHPDPPDSGLSSLPDASRRDAREPTLPAEAVPPEPPPRTPSTTPRARPSPPAKRPAPVAPSARSPTLVSPVRNPGF